MPEFPGAHIPVEVPYEIISAELVPATPFGEVVLLAPEGMRVVDAYLDGPVPFLDVGLIYDNSRYNIRRGGSGAEFRSSPTADPVIASIVCIGI